MGDETKFIPKVALDYIKNKKLQPAFSYKDVWNEEHAAAFTVAKAMQVDVLADMKKAVEKAIAEGRSFEHFKKDLKPTLMEKGWWGKKEMVDPLTGDTIKAQLGSDRRLKTIYNVNLRSAYQKAQYDRTMESDMHPYLMYRIGNSQNHREEHVAWNGLILPKDDPWWNSHFPPNGYGCNCYTRAVSEARKKRYESEGIKVAPTVDGQGGGTLRVKTEAPPTVYRTYYNERKDILERIPKGITPGFNWNQGKAGRDALGFYAMIKKAEEKYPEQIKDIAKTYLTSTIKKEAFQAFVDKAYEGTIEGDFSTPVGFIDNDVRIWLGKNKNIKITDRNVIAFEARLIKPGSPKADRHSKAGDAVGKHGAETLIDALLYGNAYFDDGNIIYLFPHSANKLMKVTVALETKLKSRRETINTPVVRNIETIFISEKDGEYMRITEKLEKIR